MNDDFYMGLALDAAWPYQGLTYPNPAVGCVIVDKNGAILAIKSHQKKGEAHAELLAVKEALNYLNPKLQFPSNPSDLHEFILKNHDNLLKDAMVYVTLEPCSHYGSTPPCSILLSSLHVRRVCIGVGETNPEASGGVEILKSQGIDVVLGVMKNECEALIAPFKAWRSGHFGFVKIGMSQNGVMSGGIITNLASREHMHKIRDRLELLVIGGNTLRTDNPRLDARLVHGKSPNVLVLSEKKNFDNSFNLFKVPDREVYIESSWERFFNAPFAMVEAGPNLFANLPESIKWMLVYRSNSFKIGETIKCHSDWRMLWQSENEGEFYGWFCRE